jgi:hypothetical protein
MKLFEQGVEGGTKAATNQQKVLARLAIIMDATKKAQGDAAKTSGSFANELKGLRASVTELATEFGTLFLPTVTRYVKTLKEALLPTAKWVGENKELVITLTKVAFGMTIVFLAAEPLAEVLKIVTVAAKAAGTAMVFLGTVTTVASVKGLAAGWALVALSLKAVATAAWAAVAPMLALVANPILIGFAAIAAALVLIIKHLRSVKQAARDAEQASRDLAEVHERFYGRERQQDIEKFSDAETKAQNARSRHARDTIAILEDQLAQSMKIHRVQSQQEADAILAQRETMRLQIDEWTRIAEAAEASAGRRIAANKAAAAAEAESAAAAKALADQRKAQAGADAPILANREKAMERLAELDRENLVMRNKLAGVTPDEQEILDLEGLRGISNFLDAIIQSQKEGRELSADLVTKDSLDSAAKSLKEQLRTREQILEAHREEARLLHETGRISAEQLQKRLEQLKAEEETQEKIRQARVFGIESLQGALTRISGAAASPGARDQEQAAKDTATNTKRTVEKLDTVVEGLKTLGRELADIFIGGPNIAVFSK